MATPQQIEQAVKGVQDQTTFLQELLAAKLGWQIGDEVKKFEEITVDWSGDELRAPDLDRRLKASQILPIRTEQPWGIFLLEFADGRVYRSALRQVLRGLVPSRQHNPHTPTWHHENLLFICTTPQYDRFTFAHFRGDKPQTAKLATFGWQKGDSHLRTLCEFNLRSLEWPEDNGRDTDEWLKQWASAFDVEAVTKRFFAEYRDVFEKVEAGIKGVPKGEPRRLYVQRLFNRLMFLYFIQRKGWLSFQGKKNYLRALFNAACDAGEDFLNERLYWTFFYGLNTAGEDYAVHSDSKLKERRGVVPFLNGGLFDLEDEYDVRDRVKIPNDTFAAILDLFERYNFTVTESTPLDVEVAVDPEMLGKVFEELVTGRHETGSYYTPRPIVAFMCREALKHYLTQTVKDEAAVARFVDGTDPSKLPDPEAVLNALRRVKVCDPACGSGAYLLGMMQELLRLREALFARHGLDSLTVYNRKLDIIQNNVYGVDIDVFAVNIAKLRLWLSLAVDFEGAKPPPLPNLDFKIEQGDSLTAPNPQELPDLFRGLLVASADRLADLKGQFLQTYGAPKKKLAGRINAEEEKLRESLHEQLVPGSVDWRVAFAEVFKTGGFDIALANPPYLRQEVIKQQFGDDYKPMLTRLYPESYVATADIYVAFYARAHQLVRNEGIGCFISSNKWLKAGYGEKLRHHLLDQNAFWLVVDFGELPVFQAGATFPAVFLWEKRPREERPTTWAVVNDLQACYAYGIHEYLHTIAKIVPASQFGKAKPRLAGLAVADLRARMEAAGTRLGEFLENKIFNGVKTGLNEAFVIDADVRLQLLDDDPKCADIIRPFLLGDDIRRFEIHSRRRFVLYVRWDTDIRQYPTVSRWLETHREKLAQRDGVKNNGNCPWFALSRPRAEIQPMYESPKIVYPDIGKEPRFTMDTEGYYVETTAFLMPADWYLLGVLNSAPAFQCLKTMCAVLGDEAHGGRVRLKDIYVKMLPIPHASAESRRTLEALAQKAHKLHGKRRKRVETFLHDLGVAPTASRSRNPLERPWMLAPKEFGRRAKNSDFRTFSRARDETAGLTEQINEIEREIDDHVAALYGL